jgi:hypothetical protein
VTWEWRRKEVGVAEIGREQQAMQGWRHCHSDSNRDGDERIRLPFIKCTF